jgi:hypothetical protein
VKDYGPLGRRYPVQTGQTWRVGRHLFVCGSMFALPTPRPSLVYADPPWDQGLYKTFHTHAGLAEPSRPWTDLYRRIVFLASGAPCFIEGSTAQEPEVASILDGIDGAECYAAWPVRSQFRRWCVLHYSGPPLPAGLPDLAGLRDDETVAAILAAWPLTTGVPLAQAGGLVLDPCCGLGITSRAAERHGWRSVNYELHPQRMSRAMAQLPAAAELVP